MLSLLENPTIREAFFPTGAQVYTVEPACPDDEKSIRAIAERQDGREAAKYLRRWWQAAPETFTAVHDGSGKTVGFYCMFDAGSLNSDQLPDDPLVQSWRAHLLQDPVPARQRVLFLRRWLSEDAGEGPSPIQAACWLDIKRTYLRLRPGLRRVYLALRDLPIYAPVALTLEFRPIPGAQVQLGRDAYQTAMLDFGPSSVDGWLARL